jgi:hypothetical protein
MKRNTTVHTFLGVRRVERTNFTIAMCKERRERNTAHTF